MTVSSAPGRKIAALSERDRVVAVRDFAHRVLRPGDDGTVVVAVEGAVVQALRFQENHRVVVLDRGDQQALGVVGIRRHHRAQAADVGEHRFRALAVGLAAVDAAAARHADRQGRGEIAGRAVAQARRFGDDLVGRRIKIIGELDLDHRAQAIGAHADRGADDAAFGNRRVEHARLAVLFLQAVGGAEDAAEIADVLAIHHDVVVAPQHHVHGRAQCLDHGHLRGLHVRIIVSHHLTPPILDVGGAGARACPCRHPRTSTPRSGRGHRPACRTVRLPFARPALRLRGRPGRDRARRPTRRRAWSGAGASGRSGRRAGSAPSRRPGGSATGSSEVEWGPAR